MTRSELEALLAEANPDLTLRDVGAMVDTFFETVTKRLEAGGRVELRGFGTFSTRPHDARTGRNPRSGALVMIRPKRVLIFKASKVLQASLNVPLRIFR